ncbi:MAG: Crp/Fnr family transcriptional regulator [Oscillibacter sp.]|nr:Crp/Fnr family transcriptional regulator [Oscillibacter sp.]
MNTGVLAQSALFQGMTEAEIHTALDELRVKNKAYEKGSVILHAGETTDRMGMVLSGRVTVESTDVWGNRTILSLLDAGQFFAEAYALLPGEILLVDVRVVENCRILFLSLSGIKGHSEPWAEKLLLNLLTVSARKNLALSGRSFHTSPKTVRGRVMAYLNTVSLQQHSRKLAIPFDRQQMADYLNLDRTALSKELGKMRELGLIAYRKNWFEIL